MTTAIPELDTVSRQLMSLEPRKKPKMLVVDDEPDNLDLLYRTFRRDFTVLRAESGTAALQVLAEEGEVAVIISDQRMPEMKGTEFLSKTVPQFPDTMRIILTGFTDVEDLVEAINSGQVYKYITKPWDPVELKGVVQRATETYHLFKQRSEELRRAQAQANLLSTILEVTRKAPNLAALLEPIAAEFGSKFNADGCILQQVDEEGLTASGNYSPTGNLQNWLDNDPLVQRAIATKTMQVAVNVASDQSLTDVSHYRESGTEAHLIVPVSFQDKLLALLSLQWQNPCSLTESELLLLNLCTQQLGLAIACKLNNRIATPH